MTAPTENDVINMEAALNSAGWYYRGADSWGDPITGVAYGVVAAREVMREREDAHRKRMIQRWVTTRLVLAYSALAGFCALAGFVVGRIMH